jgi:hypothetical protein
VDGLYFGCRQALHGYVNWGDLGDSVPWDFGIFELLSPSPTIFILHGQEI